MSASALQPGGELERGKYRIIRPLGQGGMGIVYEAEHVVTRKRVAIKWMHPSVASASGGARMVREAQAAVRVRHRHAVDVYDVVQEGDTVFLVMEYLEGEPLSTLLARNDVPIHRVIALLIPAMRAVAAAHRKGVVHRDIKPENIFLAREEDSTEWVPKVLDFGISKVDHGDLPHESLTHEGSAIGTPRYMSLEQLSGDRQLDGRADVYAFGVILYEALTGRAPYDAKSFAALIGQVVTQKPRAPEDLRPEIPSVLGRLMMWALERERDERLPSIDAFIHELEPFASARGFQSERPSDATVLAAIPVERATSQIRKVTAPPASSRPEPEQPAAVAATTSHRRKWQVGVVVTLLAVAATVAITWPRAGSEPRMPVLPETPKVGTVQPAASASTPTTVLAVEPAAAEPPASPASAIEKPAAEPPRSPDKPVRRWGPKRNAAPTSASTLAQVVAPPSPAAEPAEVRDSGAATQKPVPGAEPSGRGNHRVRLPETGEF